MNMNDTKDKAMPRPWRVESVDKQGWTLVIRSERDPIACVLAAPSDCADAELIVSRVNGWDALEAERDKLRAQVAELRAALEDILSLVSPIDTEEDVLYTTATGVLARTAPAEGRER